MDIWIPITVFAAFMQNLRSALQKKLTGSLSTGGASFSRFVFGLPVAAVYAGLILSTSSDEPPRLNTLFFVYCVIGGTAQIVGTALLVGLFKHRNFAVGTAYSKTETVQTALFGIIVLGEVIHGQALVGILVSLTGVVAISLSRAGASLSGLARDLASRPALMGIASGACFGIAAVSYRGAALSLGGTGFLGQAATTLVTVLTYQTLAMGVWLAWREPGQVTATIKAWRVALLAGASGALASIGWFTAMTIQNAAYVRALGQIELVFTFAVSWFYFREKSKPSEVVGVVLICVGIILLVV